MKPIVFLFTALFFLNISIANDQDQSEEQSYIDSLFQEENLFIGPQPQKTDIKELKEKDIETVINFRTDSEMEDLDYYQDYMLDQYKINYIRIPIGGDENEYSPQKLQQFAEALESQKGKVLLHCKSGHRASQLWAAYLVKYKGMTPDQAIKKVSHFNWWPLPMEKLIDQKLSLSIVDEIK